METTLTFRLIVKKFRAYRCLEKREQTEQLDKDCLYLMAKHDSNRLSSCSSFTARSLDCIFLKAISPF